MVILDLFGSKRLSVPHTAKTEQSDNQLLLSNSTIATASKKSLLLSHDSNISSEYIADEAELAPLTEDPPDLHDLNQCLQALASLFPDVQVEVFREMLSSFDGESRLFVVADTLLKNRVTWVKGRWKIPDKLPPSNRYGGVAELSGPREESDEPSLVLRSETFRTPEYKKAVKSLAWQEFKGLSKSTINAILAENNYEYLPARRELVRLGQKSWRFALSSLLFRRGAPTKEVKDTSALVNWRSTGKGAIEPTLKSTGNAELDKALFAAVIVPLRTEQRSKQVSADQDLAKALNKEEAEKENALFDCACCYSEVTFEELCVCTGGAMHPICFRCVHHCVSEAVFGQGWRTIDIEHGTLKCPAVEAEECTGLIPHAQLTRAITSQPDGAGIMLHLDHRLVDVSLVQSGLPLVRCPFCDYAEIDEIYLPSGQNKLKIRFEVFIWLYPIIGFMLFYMKFEAAILAILFFLAAFYASPVTVPATPIAASVKSEALGGPGEKTELRILSMPLKQVPTLFTVELRAAVTRYLRRKRGLRFTCESPSCGRSSCLVCRKAWSDIHICNESSLVELRTKVEQAMSLAIKRVCPRCNTSFVKSSGCNKLTCPCGYKMCYVCRKDIGEADYGTGEGYRHFCDHFRPEGDGSPCKECDRCNLWEQEDTDAVLACAKERAEHEWRAREGRELKREERQFLEIGLMNGSKRDGFHGVRYASLGSDGNEGLFGWLCRRGQMPTLSEVCDTIIEAIFV